MINQNLDSYSNEVFGSGLGMLGLIVWQSIRDLRVTEPQLQALAQKHGMPTHPTLGHPSDAFRRATSSIQQREGHVRYLVRPVVDNDMQIVRHVVVESVNTKMVKLEHQPCGYMVFNKSTQKVETGFLSAQGAIPQDVLDHVQGMMDQAVQNHNTFLSSLTGPELTRFSMGQLSRMSNVTVHPNGGVYFVPSYYRDSLRALQSFIRELSQYAVEAGASNTFTVVPVPNIPDQAQVVADGFRAGAERDIDAMMGSLAEMLQSPTKPGQKVVGNRMEEITAVRTKVTEYAKLLGIKVDELTVKLDILDGQADELLSRANGKVADRAMQQVKDHPAIGSLRVSMNDDGDMIVASPTGMLFSLRSTTHGYRLCLSPRAAKGLPVELVARGEVKAQGSSLLVSAKDPQVIGLFTKAVLDMVQGNHRSTREVLAKAVGA